VKITSGIEVVINNACSFVDLFMATESICRKSTPLKFSEIQGKTTLSMEKLELVSLNNTWGTK
jgi:hypothetical protein